ncbi:cytochrome P450 [Rhodococcus pseudokoreensis]|uniref:Cytochrome P450 n=1 Tax=Rhodococcus pseudokoreensis TaxID=2811421 RepID=A0A974ZXA4_9NOCA|nr:cytochrome P450 [Rhodococcus pseudokoreensis]QSE93775.1 cytochrome P450 [Rhodococcus pseudokoreensis]
MTGCPVAHTAAGFSFFDREYQENPGASLAWARESQPVFYNDDSDYWVVTRHEDVKSVFSQFNHFSAAITLTPVTPPSEEAGAQLGKYNFAPCPVLADSDPPMHRQYRRLNAPAFMPDRIDPLAPYIRDTTNAYIDQFVDQGHADLVADMLWDIPCLVALQFLGIPEEDVDTVRKLATSMTEFVWGRPSPEEQIRAADGLGQFWEMGERVIGKLKELDNPPGWLGHAITMQREHPDVISDTWLQTNVMGGAMAAHETTTNATANAVVTLLRNRDQWDRLCADPSLIPAAVEECLRLNPSVAAWRRVAKQDVQVGDVTIPAGGKILMVIASANQDGSVFDDPERFDIDRDAKAHIAFGAGTHMCLGNHLARLEMIIYLEELTRRLPHMTLDHQEFHYVPNTSFRGPESLHVSWDVEKNPVLT